ncbi:MAG: sigma-70 family RNA polymerase sigma factor [Capsulimonas sp.]|uniref:sigma-70 family RNA polymerase sigma factor n=1 Tax=Capsulimonas sp. TaxID=2494211 RepID=UPI0032678735
MGAETAAAGPSQWDGQERRSPSRLDDEARARRLLIKYKAGGSDAAAAREALVLQFRPLVQKQARQFMSAAVPLEDLIQEGFLGLMHGIDQYDQTRGVKLITYATHHIDGHLRHFLRDRVQIIKEPAWLQELAQKVRREIETLTQSLGREPTDQETAQSLGLAESEIVRIKSTRAIFAVTSLDEAQETGGPAAHVAESNLRATTAELPIEDRVVLENALVRLKEIEQKVLYSFYYEDRSQTDIARALGVSNNYISHILKNSARKLQQMFRSDAVREAALQHEGRRKRIASLGPIAADDYDEAPTTVVDAVTGLYTKSYFEARLEEEVSRAKRHELELSVVRVLVGNDLPEASYFAQVAQTVNECMRRSDLVARIGDHEIGAMLPHTGTTKEIVRKRLITQLIALRDAMPHPFTITLGAASFPEFSHKNDLMDAAAPVNALD